MLCYWATHLTLTVPLLYLYMGIGNGNVIARRGREGVGNSSGNENTPRCFMLQKPEHFSAT